LPHHEWRQKERVVNRRYANELAEGERVDHDFALRTKEMRATRSGDAYLTVDLADRSGSIPAVCFRPSADALSTPVGAVVRVRGVVTSFRGVKRVSIEQMRPASRWDASEIMATASRPSQEMFGEFTSLMRSIGGSELKRVLRAVFGDREFLARFRQCPGSQSYHHAFLGGLIEHTVAVAALCDSLAERYGDCDRDLLVTAALLHDVGKCDELSFDTSIEFTDRGRLLGHVILGVERVRGAMSARGLDVATETIVRVEHAMLSHHGELEWGSPKRPSTLEALMLHHADNLDAKAAGFSAILSGAARAEETWTDAMNLFRRPLHAPRAVEDDRPSRPCEDVSYASQLSA
jgi:3'-5' exoribonuclease